MSEKTMLDWLDHHCAASPDKVWLRDRKGDIHTEWTWSDARGETLAVAAWLEERYGAAKASIVLLSRNRAHWFIADLAIMASGNVTVPMFTTSPPATARYIFDFTQTRAVILGETANWEAVRDVMPEGVDVITLPGVHVDQQHTAWSDILEQTGDARPRHIPKHDELITIVFTSGTTGVPKGVMQSHDSMLIPMERGRDLFGLGDSPRFLSYLPLSHIAERQLVLVQSLLYGGVVTFNESLETLARDMADTRPSFFFGAPRVWEQLQQAVIARFGSQDTLAAALVQDSDGTGRQIRHALGLDDARYLLTAAAPTPPALIEWYEELGLKVLEGFGQTEIMAAAVNTHEQRRIGSIGCLAPGVELKITDDGEILFRAGGAALGYYKMPDKTAETFVDGWICTGDKGYVDDDGFIFLTGRIKDYFKTVQGKYVAPPPIENLFADNPWTAQLCLLGRGYSKTVMVCVISEAGQKQEPRIIEEALIAQTKMVNDAVEKHARIGAVLLCTEPWTIENEVLTPTLKIRRDEVEARYGERARALAMDAAVSRRITLEWAN